jgi:hypothetical protein
MAAIEVMIVGGLLVGYAAMMSRVRCVELPPAGHASIDLAVLQTQIGLLETHLNRELSEHEGLAALITAPPGTSGRWCGPYLKRDTAPNDPWGQTYVYRSPASGPRRLLSLGFDRKEGTADDIVVTLDRYLPYAPQGEQTCPFTD